MKTRAAIVNIFGGRVSKSRLLRFRRRKKSLIESLWEMGQKFKRAGGVTVKFLSLSRLCKVHMRCRGELHDPSVWACRHAKASIVFLPEEHLYLGTHDESQELPGAVALSMRWSAIRPRWTLKMSSRAGKGSR